MQNSSPLAFSSLFSSSPPFSLSLSLGCVYVYRYVYMSVYMSIYTHTRVFSFIFGKSFVLTCHIDLVFYKIIYSKCIKNFFHFNTFIAI